MIVTLWGVRGSVACSGPEIVRYGGNTSCVEVRGNDDAVLIFDAGTGIRRMGVALEKRIKKIHIFLTHLHLDHIQGLGFFTPLFDPEMEVHIYGPESSDNDMFSSLTKYFTPPLFPIFLRDLPCKLHLHSFPTAGMKIGELFIYAEAVIHPGWTLGYRIDSPNGSLAYLPDHELTFGAVELTSQPLWTSGYELALGVDLLIHDTQYSIDEYQMRVGWGHSTIEQALEFAKLAQVKAFVSFHHDPAHNDHMLDALLATAIKITQPSFKIYSGQEGSVFKLDNGNITTSTIINMNLLLKLKGIFEQLSTCISAITECLEICLTQETETLHGAIMPRINKINDNCLLLKQKLPMMLLSETITTDVSDNINEHISIVCGDLRKYTGYIEDSTTISLKYFREKKEDVIEAALLNICAILKTTEELIEKIESSQVIDSF